MESTVISKRPFLVGASLLLVVVSCFALGTFVKNQSNVNNEIVSLSSSSSSTSFDATQLELLASSVRDLQTQFLHFQTRAQHINDQLVALSTATSSQFTSVEETVQLVKEGFRDSIDALSAISGTAVGQVTAMPLWFTNPSMPYNITVPDSIYTIWVSGCAGGGGGSVKGSSTPLGAGGGGGQCVINQLVHVNPGDTLNISVGAGGPATQNGGMSGGNTVVGSITLVGGGGAFLATSGKSGGPSSFAGGIGDQNQVGRGGGTPFTDGGFCVVINTAQPAQCYHGGYGGGGYGGYSGLQYAAGGSSGFVSISW